MTAVAVNLPTLRLMLHEALEKRRFRVPNEKMDACSVQLYGRFSLPTCQEEVLWLE